MFGFGGTKIEKKLVKIHVQSIQLPVMNILDEGEFVSLYLERSEKHTVHTSEKAVTFLRNGDYGVTFDEDISVPVTMKRLYNGDLKEKLCQVSVRKRKKGSQGQKESPDAFRIIAWVDIDIKKYAETNKENYISIKLNWSEKGKDYLGKGALLNAILSVEESTGDDDDTESVASKTVSSTAANKKSAIAAKDKKVSNPFGDDDDYEDDIHEVKKVQTKQSNSKSMPKEDSESYKYGNKKSPSNPPTNKKKMDDEEEESEEEEQESSGDCDENSDDENDKGDDTAGRKNKANGKKLTDSKPTSNYTLKPNHKKNVHEDEDEDEDPFSFDSGRDHQNDADHEESDQMKPLVGFPVKPTQLDTSVRSNNSSSHGGGYEKNPLKAMTKGVTGVVGGVVDGVKSGVSGVTSGVSGVVGGVVGGVKGGVNTILRRESNPNNEDEAEDEGVSFEQEQMQRPLPKFLTEFKERTYNESAMQRMQKRNFANLSYSEILVLKLLEESRLENVSLREKCIDFEMQALKCEFFANEVARVQDLVNTETESKEKLEAEINDLQNQITSKIEENGYLVDELVSTKAKRDGLDTDKRDVMANIESLKLLAKQEKIKRDLLEQKRLKEEREKNSWW